MPNNPNWLPEIASVNGEWAQVRDRLYAIFFRDFKNSQPIFRNMPVWHDRRVLPGEIYEEGFWHLITKSDAATAERLLDPRRTERLPWCKPVLVNSADKVVLVWSNSEQGGKTTTYVWLRYWDYVIILREKPHRKGPIAFLVTAYHVEGGSTRNKFLRKYENRIS